MVFIVFIKNVNFRCFLTDSKQKWAKNSNFKLLKTFTEMNPPLDNLPPNH